MQRLPRVPELGEQLPRLERLFAPDQSPLTTSMHDAPMPLRCLDTFQPSVYQPLRAGDRPSGGAWRLAPGLYEITVHSFCGRHASYAPHKALGYLPAPYKGRIAGIVQSLVRRYTEREEVEWSDAQALVWGLLSRVKPSALKGRARAAAERLLTPQEIRELDGVGVDALRDEVVRRLLPQVREALRPLIELENRVRRYLTEGTRSYQELEQLVMRPLDPNDKILVEPKHWYWHPRGGCFVRYEPNGFSRVRLRLWVPQPIAVEYDSRGRIVSMARAGVWRIRVLYDDGVEPWRCPREPRWLAYRFHTVQFERLDQLLAHTESVNGWLFAVEKRATAAGGVRVASAGRIGLFQRAPSWVDRWLDRVDSANQTRRELQSYPELAERGARWVRGEPSADPLMDREHYVNGVRDAIRGTSAERIEWIAETHANSAEALANAINLLNQLPTGSADYDPTGSLAAPGSQGGQRLLVSGRS